MKRQLTIALSLIAVSLMTISAALMTQCKDEQNPNPLLRATWNTPHQTAPFSEILPEHYMPAVKEQMALALAGVDAIVNNSEEPTFENTIVALEYNGMELSRTLGIFYNLIHAETNEQLQAIDQELSPLLTEYSNDISLNEKLFQRIKTVYDKREGLNLKPHQAKLLEDTYKGFERGGANLTAEQKEKYRILSKELSEIGVKFSQNALAATNAYEMNVTDEKRLGGLPEAVKEAAAAEAKQRGKEGWVFTLQYPSYVPFIQYAADRELRKEIWTAKATLCAKDGEYDNREIIKRIAELRLETAKLLGFETFADYALDNRMAQSSERVETFLNELLDKSLDFAHADKDMIQKYANEQGLVGDLQPWDFAYYNNKYETDHYAINDEVTRPYFQIEKAEEALFMLANKLYGITFVENKEIPVYHPEVKAFEVKDKDGSFLAVLYCDYFPRAGKRSGAWMNTYRDAYIKDGKETRPIVVLVNNFTKPTETKPSLLSFGEFTTMLHEFGHGLHGIFGKGEYPSQTCTNVYRDFVELPSQIMENWANEKEYLDLFAVHYETGEKMPEEIINKLIAKKNHMAAYNHLRQLSLGMLDMAWHTITEPVTESVEAFETAATSRTQLMPVIKGAMTSPSFSHIFAGGYSAGYYSYKWAEVLEADAYSKFMEKGIFDQATATSFRENILSKGGTEHPMELYKKFAGAEPTAEPLLRKMGLIK